MPGNLIFLAATDRVKAYQLPTQVTQGFLRWPGMVLSAIRTLLIVSDLYVYWIDGGPASCSSDLSLNLYHMIITCA